MDEAEHVVDALLETTEKWDNALKTFRKLYRLKQKSLGLFQDMGRALEYEQALAKAGVRKEDVAHPITGAAIGATHNYKGKRPAKRCPQCRLIKPLPMSAQQCAECGGPLEVIQVPLNSSDLRGNWARHIVGVELKDGRYVWFDRQLSRTPWMEWEQEEPEEPRPDKLHNVSDHLKAGGLDPV